MEINFSEAELIKKIQESPKKTGSWNIFVKLNNKLGLKLTPSKKNRDANYARQTAAAKHGLGPDTYGTTEVTINFDTYYGYFTEVVEVCGVDEEISSDKLCHDLSIKIGFDFVDNFPRNMGWKNNELVCIDFDDICNQDSNLEWEEIKYRYLPSLSPQ